MSPTTSSSGTRRDDKRRPSGISRRRKRQLGFETLEDRRVMSAQSPVAQLASLVSSNLQMNVQSYSSATAEGQVQQLLNEMYWQSLSSGNGAAAAESRSIPTDPLLSSQWHLINSGQNVGSPDWQPIYGRPGEDINVASVWNQDIFGNGVVVAVIDSGVQLNHPDLAANIDLTRQLNSATGLPDGSPANIALLNPLLGHGTSVAGLIGAVANNGLGGAGVAPGVTLVPINNGGFLGLSVVNALRYAYENGVDITNNSYGPSDALRTLAGPTVQELLALRDSVIFGRDGLGMINVWAAGNGAGQYGARPGFSGVGVFDSSNYDGYANSRYTIAVTGVDHDGSYSNADGTVTNYMEAGANVLVAAPTGSVFLDIANDSFIGSGLYTTDLYTLVNGRDVAGFNTAPNAITNEQDDFARDFLADTSYTSRFNGTSGAAPIVSGVVALMLEANPNLTWRDVQEILLRSARQNDPLGIPTNGAGAQSKNPWIVNQTPMFSDPDLFVPNIPILPFNRTYLPTLDPSILGVSINVGPNGTVYSDHLAPSPSVLTNGAGYTVAQGRGVYGDQMGYGHGVVDAALAVSMAQQWGAKNQALPGELTYTTFVNPLGNAAFNIPAAERSNNASGNLIVPGAIGGLGGFISLWNEYFDATPFDDPTQLFPFRGNSSIEFSVPPSNTMTIESVDVKISLTADSNAAEAMDHLRLMLVSPSGTYSDLNHYWYDAYQTPFTIQDTNDSFLFFGDQGSVAPATGFTWTFNTNRSWGERSDDALIINPVTNEPYTDTLGVFGNANNPLTAGIGEALRQGWRLVVENWDANDDFGLQGVEVAWHGSPIAAASKRVQGIVGIDTDGNDAFNFSRVISSNIDLDGDGEFNRVGEVQNVVDLTQEQFAANATVTVRKTSDGSLVDQFVTGHDGNFYFDLVPDFYTITVEDSTGLVAKDDATTNAQFLRHFQKEWKITPDYFRAWDHDPTIISEVLVDGTGTPKAWVDNNGSVTATGVKGINFLLDPGAPVAQQAEFSGAVYADVNGNGAFDGDDVYLPNVTVYGDVNRNGAKDAGEFTALTDAQGKYSLIVPITQATVLNVGVASPPGWTATKPITTNDPNPSLFGRFVLPGDEFALPDFALKPPANNAGSGNLAGYLLGVVYSDNAGTGAGSRQAGEQGAANVTVYIDANNNGTPEATEAKTITNDHGAYVFSNVTPGQKVVRIVVASPMIQTAPNPGLGRVVTLTGSSTISNIQFGVRNTAVYDFGDLPLIYGATLASQNGARHRVGPYYLGAPGSKDIDAELDGIPSLNADGDDVTAPGMDEDGITFGAMSPGATVSVTVQATASGFLQGWIDWNNDGDFNDVGERVFTNEGVNQGSNNRTINVPASANSAKVYARFRYGAPDLQLNDPVGGPYPTYGEVEDYRLDVAIPVVAPIVANGADADNDGYVTGDDFLLWQRNMGRTSGATKAQGDANGDHAVNGADLAIWRGDYGDTTVIAAVTVANSADFNDDGNVDGDDFLLLQRGVGLGHPSEGAGDANHDGVVNSGDFAVWTQQFGQHSGHSSSVAEASAASSTAVTMSVRSSGSPAIAASVADAAYAETLSRDAPAAAVSARAALNGRPFISLASDTLADRVSEGHVSRALHQVAEGTVAKLGKVRELFAEADFGRDRAFDDLLGSRRRQGLLAELASEDDGDEVDCDAAFAAFADHFDWSAE